MAMVACAGAQNTDMATSLELFMEDLLQTWADSGMQSLDKEL